jgi:superfamily II DNA/RNA helicase
MSDPTTTRNRARTRSRSRSTTPTTTTTAAATPAATAPTSTGATFAELGVPTALLRVLDERGLSTPFPIQTATLPDALAGRDLAGRAPTGSGKTLAFSLPLAVRAGKGRPGSPRALVLVPTRELAAQVHDTLAPLAARTDRSVVTIYGGTSIRTDQQRLRRGVDIVVATPGRLEDLVKRGDLRLGAVDLVVLDEADRMADMGFLPVVTRLLDATAKDRQTLLFSATLDGDVDVLVRRYQRNPVRHEVEVTEEATGDVRHLFFAAERPDRRAITGALVRDRGPAIVFTRTKHGADRLAKQLAQDGISTAAIHGNRTQGQRERALAGFTSGAVSTLVATDVAARGIHVDQVAVVVHHDLPATDKDYVHRSGRTGRAGATGIVVTLVAAEQAGDLDAIQRSLDLPRGVHPTDVELLDASDLPGTRPLGDAPATPRGQQRNGGQNRSGGQQRTGGQNRGGQHRSGGQQPTNGGRRRRARR